MATLNPRLLAELKKCDGEICEEDLFLLMPSDLDPERADKKVRGLTAFFKNELRVYADGEHQRTEPMENIERFTVTSGVGCVFLSYQRKNDGGNVLFARGDSRYRNLFGQCAKRANHYLRFGDLDFSRLTSAEGGSCPKCGKPYPHGSHTCPHCVSKKKILRRLVMLAKPEWKYIAFTALLFVLTTAIGVITPYINRVLVDDYIQNTGAEIFLFGFIGVILSMLAVNLLRRAVSVVRGYFLTVAGNSFIVRLRDMVFEKIQQLSIAKILRHTSGELMKRVNSDTRTIKQFLINQLPNLLEQALLLLAVALLMLFYDWRLALLILIPAPFVALAFRFFWRFIRTLMHRRRELNGQGSTILHDIFSGIRVVKSYGMEKREEERFVGISVKERDAQLRLERFWAVLMPLLQFAVGIGEYALLYYVGTKMLSGEMTAGEMSQFSSYASMVFSPLTALMVFPRQFMQMMTSVTRVYEILDEPVDIQNGTQTDIGALQGYIDIDHISFGYEESDEVLRDIDLHIQPGEFIGLVGKSGVGKSTLINLIMRMYDVDEGEIRIDGTDIRDIPQEKLRAQMGVVLQESFLFTGSVWQNLTYAKPDATPEEVIQAAKSAGAHEFIIRLPDGYNTYVGEKGHTLSGGERQRISIARALLHNPKILILDEATASLDTETEKLIQDALLALSAGRTTIAIAHRLSTLRNANRLVVLDKGEIAEIGSHEELMEKKGIYYGLVMAQREMTKMENDR
ncbi:MAG: ATP-binding cassette domain-containing protein [Clostridia bacterium]|nr:ATP-binding cassette domain-containing protein [Clostridia bacterium]